MSYDMRPPGHWCPGCGMPLLVGFWRLDFQSAQWCPPCYVTLPSLSPGQRLYSRRRLQ